MDSRKAMYKTRNTGTGNGTRGIRGMLPNIPGNVLKHSGECKKFRGIFENNLWHIVKHSVESMKGFE